MNWTTHVLADFVLRMPAKKLPASAREAAQKCILDLLAASIAGFKSLPVKGMRNLCSKLFNSGSSNVWFSNLRLSPMGAALANSAAASALDLDDGHRAAMGHPGAAIIPAALAAAREVRADGEQLLAAIILGYETAVRVAAARDHESLDTLATGRWASYGVVAAAGRLYQLSSQKMAEAMAIAGVSSPGLSAAGYSSVMGNSVKEGIPWATFTALSSLELANQDYTGPVDILDHPDYFSAQKIRFGLGDDYLIDNVYFKPYSCCRWIHSALDACLALIENRRINPDQIQGIEVYTFSRVLRLNNYTQPQTLESAQYSLPFCLAAACLRGKNSLLPMSKSLLEQTALTSFAKKIKITIDSALDAEFPRKTPARVEIRTLQERFVKQVDEPLGDPGNPMDIDSIEKKFHHLAADKLSLRNREQLIQFVKEINTDKNIDNFFNVLSQIKIL